jgi:hypothetical protein
LVHRLVDNWCKQQSPAVSGGALRQRVIESLAILILAALILAALVLAALLTLLAALLTLLARLLRRLPALLLARLRIVLLLLLVAVRVLVLLVHCSSSLEVLRPTGINTAWTVIVPDGTRSLCDEFAAKT